MKRNKDMKHQENDRPNCCEMGNKQISWGECLWDDLRWAEEMFAGFTGWVFVINKMQTQISYCPFCGKKLEE